MNDKPKGISLDELARIQAGEKRRQFTAEDERRHALRLLAQLADLTQKERGRVLRRALKINEA